MPTPIGHSLWSISLFVFFHDKFKDVKEIKKDILIIVLCLIIGLSTDIDFIFYFFNHNPYFHRSITHSIVFALTITFVSGYILRRKSKIRHPFMLSFLLVSGHLFWDFLTKCDRIPYGTMFFWPFSNKYFQTPLIIFPGFDWWTLKELFSIYLLRQIFVEVAVFLPILFLAVFLKKERRTYL